MLSFFVLSMRTVILTVPHNERRRDDVSSMVLLIGLLAGARVRNRRATESPRLFLLLPLREKAVIWEPQNN